MIQGGLFTREFLLEGVTEEPAWAGLDSERVEAIRRDIGDLLTRLSGQRAPNEAETEHQLIFPLLREIGWDHILPQQNLSTGGRQDVPDALLFADGDALERARPESPWQRFHHGACVLESKRWNRPLDRPLEGRDRRADEEGVPSNQMLRYMRRADDVTRGRLRWGMLTNGRLWRLYWQGAVYESENYIEIDLGKVFGLPGCEPDLLDPRDLGADHAFRLFLLIFGPEAFRPVEQGRTFHDIALETGKRWEERVARNLSRVVFQEVFPVLTAALGERDPDRPPVPTEAWLETVRQGALILLYRLLFVLYAEDRNLLPDETGPYRDYALTRIRQEVAKARADGATPSPRMAIYWHRLRAIFTAISGGDDDLGVPEYNGGLFDPLKTPILERVELPDAVIAEVVFRLSHVDGDRGPRYVNYRDLSVQQLGSIYERILEFGLKVEDGRVAVDTDAGERHDTGSFYTPEALVSLIIDRAVGPLVEARLAAFAEEAERLAHDRRPVEVRREELERLDPASAMLDLRVCDPAMGSGHFLVSLVEWLAARVLEATAEATALVSWTEYVSPLTGRIERVRERILAHARDRHWPIVQEQLDDPKIVRRMILKRVVHGVDKNPMAVELAKVALWLHTFTVGAPLSFLDHHLRCGDSLVGAWTRPTIDAVEAAGGLLARGQIVRIENVAGAMTRIEQTTDNDITEVRRSKDDFSVVGEATADLDAFFSLMTAGPLLSINLDAKRPRETPEALRAARAAGNAAITEAKIIRAEAQQLAFDRATGWRAALGGEFGDPVAIAAGRLQIAAPGAADDGQAELLGGVGEGLRQRRLAAGLVEEARAAAARERFLHWQIAFPNLWSGLDQPNPVGGFDAVIGNPPYVRQEKLAGVKPALKAGYEVFAGTADLYVYFFEQGLRLVRPGGRVAYVVNNKWLKAGYAEPLRAMLTDPARAQTEALIDFGHARGFFPDADVFPNVAVIRRPAGGEAPAAITVSVPPRDTLPDENLPEAVKAASFPLAREAFSREGWTLEPKPVMELLAKIRAAGTPLDACTGVTPYRGVLTGFNEAFLIDQVTRERLVKEDRACEAVIKPYLRGQDVGRWSIPPNDLYMILLKSSGDYVWPWASESDEAHAEQRFKLEYPSLHRHMKKFESFRDPVGGELKGLRHRQDRGRNWWELRSCAYYEAFDRPKIVYQEIQFYPRYALDRTGLFSNNKMYFLPLDDPRLLATLNSPLMWWHNWRYLPHMKDEALSPMGFLFEKLPIAVPGEAADEPVRRLIEATGEVRTAAGAIHDWLKLEFGLDRPGRALEAPETLDADGFAAAVRAALPKRRALSAAEVARLKREHADTVEPARLATLEIAGLERTLSDLVNAAYGLTPEDVALMWRTAPPRMPLTAGASPPPPEKGQDNAD